MKTITDEQIKEAEEDFYSSPDARSLKEPECNTSHWMSGLKWYRDNEQTIQKIEELRGDIEKQTETMDLIKDSDLIQLFGSIVGRLNIIINKQ